MSEEESVIKEAKGRGKDSKGEGKRVRGEENRREDKGKV